MTLFKFVAAALIVFGIAIPAQAVTLAWTLSGVTFDDGGTASGTFTTDSTTGVPLTYDIFTTTGSTLGGFHYDVTSSFAKFYRSDSISFDTPYHLIFLLIFDHPLTSIGVNALTTGPGGSYECANCGAFRGVTAGSAKAVVAAVPEPATWVMMIAGMGAVGATMRRRRAAPELDKRGQRPDHLRLKVADPRAC